MLNWATLVQSLILLRWARHPPMFRANAAERKFRSLGSSIRHGNFYGQLLLAAPVFLKPNAWFDITLKGFSLDDDKAAAATDEKAVADPAPTSDTNGAGPQPEPFVAAKYSYKKVYTYTIYVWLKDVWTEHATEVARQN